MATIQAPIEACPACGSAVWDNRLNKKNPKGPDFKCKACSEAYWLPKGNGAPLTYQPKPAQTVSRTVAVTEQALPGTRDDDLIALFWASFDNVLAGVKERKLTDMFTGDNIASLTATQFIQRAKG